MKGWMMPTGRITDASGPTVLDSLLVLEYRGACVTLRFGQELTCVAPRIDLGVLAASLPAAGYGSGWVWLLVRLFELDERTRGDPPRLQPAAAAQLVTAVTTTERVGSVATDESARALWVLAAHPDPLIRAEVAQRAGLGADALAELVVDDDPAVRLHARRPAPTRP